MPDLTSQARVELELLVNGYRQAKGELEDFISTTEGAAKAAKQLGVEQGITGRATGVATVATKAHGAAAKSAERSTKGYTGSINAQRYALYDVSNALGVGGLALAAFSGLSYKAAIDYQANFANVIRTTQLTGSAATKLRENLIGLSQTTPVSFKAITDIAAMGGQLGIAASRIPQFTKTVAQFSATTDVTVDASATAFGRLNALLPDVKNNYQGLGSSILKVGINSVSTESQIVTIAARLAGIGHTAGLTSDEVIGLSGALASIGVAPELAQGTITRLFTKIQVAVAGGGEQLQEFARVSGMSAKEFQAAWSSDASGTLVKLLNGINGSGDGAIQTIQGLGLSAARDIPTLLKLSQNTDILTKSLADAKTGFDDATQLGDSFTITAGTVAGKLTMLVNGFQAWMAAVGDSSTGLGGFLDVANGFLQWATAVAKSPLGSAIATISVGLVALTGITLLAGAGMLRLAATVLAVQTANGGAVGSTHIFSTALGILTGSTTRATAAEAGLITTSTIASTSMVTAAESTIALSKANRFLIGGIITLATVLGLGVAAKLIEMGDAAHNNEMSFTRAADALKEYNKQVALSGGSNPILGNSDANREGILKKTTGFNGDAERFTRDNLGPIGSIDGFFSGFTKAQESVDKIDASMAKLVASGNAEVAAQEFLKWSDAAKVLHLSHAELVKLFPLYTAAQEGVTKEVENTVPTYEEQTQAVKDSLSAISDAISETVAQENALFSLGEALGETGNDFSVYSQAGRANLDELQTLVSAVAATTAGDAQATANNLQGLFNALTQQAGIPAAALTFLADSIRALGVATVAPTAFNMSSFVQGQAKGQAALAKTQRSAAGAAKQVRTLVDYANDLSGVFSRAFDIRFGGGQALDTITSGWSKIRQAARDAADAMADANATLAGLAADRAINEYWLSVANAYGDTLRASKIQADLAKNADDTADAQKDLTKAQAKSNKTLVGNSDAAIDNRAEILGLVGNYQSYITALASSGLSQSELATKTAQLKDDFIKQATQLGYNRDDLGDYASAFDDVSLAIGRVPRNITVTANTNPALQALAEFEAKARSMAGNSYGGGTIQAPTVEKPAYIVDPSDVTKYQQARDRGYISAEQFHKYVYGFRSGGYTGGGGTSDVAGVVHGQEFVFSAPAVKNIGVGNLAYAHQMAKRGRRGFESGGFGGGSGMSIGIMELGPKSLGVIREIARSETYAVLAATDAELAQHVKRGQESLSFSGGN